MSGNILLDYFMAEADRGWEEFVKERYKKNAISNKRLFRILTKIKGANFVLDFKDFIKKAKAKDHYIELSHKQPPGMLLGDSRWKTIPKLWVEVINTEDGTRTEVHVPITDKHFISFVQYS